MPEYNRVRDPGTQHEFTVGPVYDPELELLDEPAVDGTGRPLPPKPHLDPSDAADADGEVLRGQALTDALHDAGLSTSGTADEKRLRLAEFNAGLNNSEEI